MAVIWYQTEGMFHSFPYLHMIAVKAECQNQGIGSALLDYFEKDVLSGPGRRLRTKIFLTVGDFNPRAEALYRRRGYEELGCIRGLFRKNVTEKLMMKTVTAGA